MKAKHGLVNKYSVTLGALVSAVLLIIVGAHAQSTTDSTTAGTEPITMSASDMASLQGLSEAQLAAFISALDATPEIAYTNLLNRGAGTFYSLQHPDWPPLPADLTGSPVWPMKGFDLLNDIYFSYPTVTKVQRKTTTSGMTTTMTTMTTMTTVDTNLAPSPSGSTTNTYVITNSISFPTPDYGTNLWISHWTTTSGGITGIASNTMANVEYDFMTNGDLTTTNWAFSGQYFYGSTTTNWTAMPLITIDSTSNLFFRLRSDASSDGSGLPTWWELQYFGTTGIDPNADPMGDGWSNIQKYQDGMNPNVFYTPPAPTGLTIGYTADGTKTVVSWNPAPGSVTNYLVTVTDNNGVVATYNVGPDQLSVDADVSGILSGDSSPGSFGQNLFDTYQVTAQYAGGNSAPTVNNPIQGVAPYLYGTPLVSDSQGTAYVVLGALPTGTTQIKIVREDSWAESYGDFSQNSTHVISITNLVNGMVPIPASWMVSTPDTYGHYQYNWWLDLANSNGAATAVTMQIGDTQGNDTPAAWLVPPVYDGRTQLKQNLIFQLRAALASRPFQYTVVATNNNGVFASSGFYTCPTNYAYADFYDMSGQSQSQIDAFLPFGENYFYRNFVFDSSLLDTNGELTTGVSEPDANANGLIVYQPYGYADNLYQFPLAYQFPYVSPPASGTIIPALLPTNQTQYLATYPLDADLGQIGVTNIGINQQNNYILISNARNWFGLKFLSAKIGFAGPSTLVIDANHSTSNTGYWYPQTEAPLFRTVEYDFWNPVYTYLDQYGDKVAPDLLPGKSGFSTTNTGDSIFITIPGSSIQVAGYAKLEVTNSAYTGVYGYLGQYFSKAHQMDSNGNATTNTTGFLSPYGTFTPTEPGDTALVTMPDVDTGEQGTCIVHCVSLQLDKNHDGVMDLSFNGPDATSEASPFDFWANNNYDRLWKDLDDGVYYDDSISPAQADGPPDCNYKNNAGEREIPCPRDLEDFARLWVCGITTNLLSALPTGSTITLDWGDVGNPNPDNPTIDLFPAEDSDGGIGYLTNGADALLQTDPDLYPYIGRLGPGQQIQLNSSQFTNGWAGNHFIWCGVSNGTGGLTLTIRDANSNVLAQSTAYIQIKDIKDMYERWTVGDNPRVAPLTNAILAAEALPKSTPAFQYIQPTDTNTPYILFVHGWNMSPNDKDNFAETAFKRLYWQGYHGRFGAFRWPTDYDFEGSWIDALFQPHNYDDSENNAWKSAIGLANKLKELNKEYPGHVYMLAHSMGNVVAGEALGLAAKNGFGQIVNTYVATQAAIPAQMYDASVTSPYLIDFTYTSSKIPDYLNWQTLASYGPTTPNIYENRLTNTVAAAGRRISFYNVNDYALSRDSWCFDQALKPDIFVGDGYYYYSGNTNDAAPWNNFEFVSTEGLPLTVLDIVNNQDDLYDVLAFAAEPRSTALGATPTVTTLTRTVDMANPDNDIWPLDTSGHNYADHFWHSAEFRGDCDQMWNYWQTLLRSPTLGFNISN